MTMRQLVLLVSLLAPAAQAFAEAPGDVQHLYQAHCVSCHGSEVYTRSDRKVTSLGGLQRQVQRCELALGLGWFDEEITGVADYLNENYYKFTP
jgi:mono/diheme cytochrome c family protein